MEMYGKSYETDEEYQSRFLIYRDNAAFIRVFNSGKSSFVLGVNQFADLTNAEYRDMYLMKTPIPSSSNTEPFESSVEIPTSVDWRTKGSVTGVKNQGQCGSCWSFSTTGSIEGAWAIAENSLVSLSEQQLVDCSGSYGNQGCNGGLMDDAFKYVMKYGLTTESNYPYTASDGTCDTSKQNDPVVHISGYHDVTVDSADALKAAIAKQPVSVAVDAAGLDWQFYFGGIVKNYCGTSLDHGVLAVGYKTDVSEPYFIVKNSWGGSWGMNGYIELAIVDGKGTCGIQMSASYPVV